MENIFELQTSGTLRRNHGLSDTLHRAKIVPEQDVLWEADHGYMQTCIRGISQNLRALQDKLSRPSATNFRKIPNAPGNVLHREGSGTSHELIYGSPDGPIANIGIADGEGSSRVQFVVASPENVELRPHGGSFLQWYRQELDEGSSFIWVEIAFDDLHQEYDIYHKTKSIQNVAFAGRVTREGEKLNLQARSQIMWRERVYKNADRAGDNVRNFNSELRDRYAIAESCHWLGSAVSSLLSSTNPTPRTFK
ncbi:MAG TPA: hypothetical protein PKB09_00640 [Candidatus Saccharibacteria bacterium]|nr:hypothetical protein [Candidatus Saccharibacteria bacterium]